MRARPVAFMNIETVGHLGESCLYCTGLQFFDHNIFILTRFEKWTFAG
jgi:hypothetical protein